MAQQPSDWQKQITESLINQQRSTTPHSNDTGEFTPPPRPSTETTVPDDEKRYSPLISPLPPNAVVFKHSDPNNDSSFNRFIETEYGPVLHNRLSEGSLKQQQQPSNTGVVHNKHSDSTLRNSKHYDNDGDENLATFWTALAKDLDTKKKQHMQQASVKHNSDWYQGYDYNATESNGLPAPWWVTKHDEDGIYSVGALLFIIGFICPPLWWVGAVWPRRPRERGGKMAERWQKLNRIMSIGFSVVLILAIIICVAVWKSS
ncbi:hypothetical protein BDB00DRAFT_872781 [Zychaea mexicana]|uniref:uncharacterized protein n=1 Tax=Zychaea mexicana TaxID=64656 RepID=UPI0022FE2A78|nr:uncharacterized protein BDB00DRAFT_872781 [Zychaea mexicana]KAI9493064.1 hypothetical protein BDB00DRAFT_872781 [Zychaea mexicana]